jgi:hypothetical protein
MKSLPFSLSSSSRYFAMAAAGAEILPRILQPRHKRAVGHALDVEHEIGGVELGHEKRLRSGLDYRRANGCLSGSQAPSALLDATDCSMKYIPSTPSQMFG